MPKFKLGNVLDGRAACNELKIAPSDQKYVVKLPRQQFDELLSDFDMVVMGGVNPKLNDFMGFDIRVDETVTLPTIVVEGTNLEFGPSGWYIC